MIPNNERILRSKWLMKAKVRSSLERRLKWILRACHNTIDKRLFSSFIT
jgi:hypothetical protein